MKYTKAEAFDLLAKVIEEKDGEYEPMVLTRIRGVYYGLLACGLKEDEADDESKRAESTESAQ